MGRRIRTRLFAGAAVTLIVIGVPVALVLQPRIEAGIHPVVLAIAIVAISIATAALLAAVVSRALRHDVREIAPGARIDAIRGDALGALGDLVTGMTADAHKTTVALARERALLSSVLDGLHLGVVALDDQHRIAVMNDSARTLLGLPSTPIGEALIDVVRLPTLIELVDHPERTAAEIQIDDNHRLLVRVGAPSAGGGLLLFLEDITAVRRLETIRRDFIANVSHELRTPVAIIRANAETLVGGAKDDPQIAGKLIDGVHRNAERLARILADLLDLSRLDAGQYRFERIDVRVQAAAQAAVAVVEPSASQRGITTHVDVDVETTVRADAKALDQVLVNLVDNAVKYGQRDGNVWIRAQPSGDRIRIEVLDDGPGIAPKHRERIFERFYRVDGGRAREAGGTGLGLAIVKHLVESMGGVVGVGAGSPRGTRFWIELPRA
jgi:two-component system phosphate regulon sensor histidine kinase PhoR